MKKIILLISILIVNLFISCVEDNKKSTQKNTIFVGIDISGSFSQTASFKNGVKFLSHYIHGHLSGKGGLTRPTDLYVGGIGGASTEDPQSFFPIHDFDGRTPAEIEQKLILEFGSQKDRLTDFNTFFLRIQSFVKQKNLVLSPISIVLLTDGVPEIAKGKDKAAMVQAYGKINLAPLEYLTRNISIRMLYIEPRIGEQWKRYVPTKRIRIWSVESEVMNGWQDQLNRNGEEGLWKWIRDNIDLRIRSQGI